MFSPTFFLTNFFISVSSILPNQFLLSLRQRFFFFFWINSSLFCKLITWFLSPAFFAPNSSVTFVNGRPYRYKKFPHVLVLPAQILVCDSLLFFTDWDDPLASPFPFLWLLYWALRGMLSFQRDIRWSDEKYKCNRVVTSLTTDKSFMSRWSIIFSFPTGGFPKLLPFHFFLVECVSYS